MVNQALNNITTSFTSLIDVGTGSSCIAIAIMKNSFHIHNSYVIDISEEALQVSYTNLVKYSLENKVTQIQGNLLDDFL